MSRIWKFIKNQFTYAKYVFYHKWRVMVWGWYLTYDISFMWQCFCHDMSKFLPGEWFPYAKFFGDGQLQEDKKAFLQAWSMHLARNPHHWQYFTRASDVGMVALEMPAHYVYEMVADWQAAGEAQGNKTNIYDWYDQNKCMMTLHENTKSLVGILICRIMCLCG